MSEIWSDVPPTEPCHLWFLPPLAMNGFVPQPRPITVDYERDELCCSHTHTPVRKTAGQWGPRIKLPVAVPVECRMWIGESGHLVLDAVQPPEVPHVGGRYKCLLVPVELIPEVSIVQAFAELAAASGGRWDGVDPDKFVRDLRSDE